MSSRSLHKKSLAAAASSEAIGFEPTSPGVIGSNAASLDQPSGLKPIRNRKLLESIDSLDQNGDPREAMLLYKKNPCPETFCTVLMAYKPLCEVIARNIARKLPLFVDEEDLCSAGIFGLMEAIPAFDLERGYKFESFASYRIRGAILDHVRELDEVPRLRRDRRKAYEQALKNFTSEYNRSPSLEEERAIVDKLLASALKDNTEGEPATNQDRRAHMIADFVQPMEQTYSVQSLGHDRKEMDNRRDYFDLVDYRLPAPNLEIEDSDFLRFCLSKLEGKYREIVEHLITGNFTFKEVGVLFDLSESRVSQIMSDVVTALKREAKRQLGEPFNVEVLNEPLTGGENRIIAASKVEEGDMVVLEMGDSESMDPVDFIDIEDGFWES